MILERKTHPSVSELKQQLGGLGSDAHIGGIGVMQASTLEFTGLIQIYNGAMKEISTKLDVLDDEFHVRHSYNPIHHLECRIKGFGSLHQKMIRRGLPPTPDCARQHIQDIAGIRVICNFVDDIYLIEKLLLQQADVTLLKRKDYIANPKENGYRSLHIIVQTPVYLSDKTEQVPVEIQMRTVAMDYWASLEHMLRYKNSIDMSAYSAKLVECANALAETERAMQEIRRLS